MTAKLSVQSINEAYERLGGVVRQTPLEFSPRLSAETGAKVYLKREDLQEVRSYKIRGAYALISSLTPSERKRGVVCASAGNHAQGVASSCSHLKVRGTIFMPSTTPHQKIDRVKYFGGEWVSIRLFGNNFDEAKAAAKTFATKTHAVIVHPFDDERVMSGQGTVAKEIFDELGQAVDVVICPVGGGGLVSGVGTYAKTIHPPVKIIAVEPKGAPGLAESLAQGKVITLKEMDTFVDGAAVRTIGSKTFEIARKVVDKIVVVPEGEICTEMIRMYQNEGIVTEPAGALSVTALHHLHSSLRGKTVVCIVSGGNNDVLRYPEILERSLVYQGLKHYFIVEFAQKPGQLRRLINEVLSPTDDIVRFEYIKKNFKETGPALIGIEVARRGDDKRIKASMRKIGIGFRKLEPGDSFANFLI